MQRSFLRGQLPEARFPLVKSIEVFGNVRGSLPPAPANRATLHPGKPEFEIRGVGRVCTQVVDDPVVIGEHGVQYVVEFSS